MIIACAGVQKKREFDLVSRSKYGIKIYTQHWNLTDQTINLFLHIELPLNQFVFTKNVDHFYSNIIYTLTLHDMETNIQIYRQSWDEKVIQTYYEDTRDLKNYITTERNIELIPGTYMLSLNVQDEDSRKNWKINEEFKLDKIESLGPILPFINNDLQNKVSINIINKSDTIWFRGQVLPNQDKISNKVEYSIIRNSILIDSGKVKLNLVEKNNIHLLPISFREKKKGLYEIILSFQDVSQTVSFHYGKTNKKYWTDDINEIIGVMYYILPIDLVEKQKLNDMHKRDQLVYFNKYWENLDPSKGTSENELLIELNRRVVFVNKNFSILSPGWRSDRGKAYILNGPPEYNTSYQDEMGHNYIKWIYSTGKQFIFIDRNITGDYSLFREIH